MDSHSLEELLPKAGGSVYRLVRMASMRALELSEGIPALVDKHKDQKLTTIALHEIATGKVELKGYVENKDNKVNTDNDNKDEEE